MRREFGFNLHAQCDEVGGCDPEPPLPLAQKSLLAQLLVKNPGQTVENERVSAEARQLSKELSRQTERQNSPPKMSHRWWGSCRAKRRADLQLVGLAEAENDRRAEFKGYFVKTAMRRRRAL